MQSIRANAIHTARRTIASLSKSDEEQRPLWGLILGTLGRQGNFCQLQVNLNFRQRTTMITTFEQALSKQLQASPIPIPYLPILLSEISPAKLSLFHPHIATFVQTSCPRLSIDWGYAFNRPLLSPYETTVAVGQRAGWMEDDNIASSPRGGLSSYPMDFYEAGTPWANSRARGEF